jgi:predicted component of type VI protein secretion system
MSELTLEWKEALKIRTEKILDQQPSKNPGTVRLGRHPDLCDILFSEDEKISRLHAEIFFNREQNSFYLRKLPEGKRPLIVDGKIIIHDEAPLREGSMIILGETEIKVVAVSVDIAYGLICPNIKCRNPDKRRIVDPKHLLEGCPWCGTSLAAAQSFHRL